MKTFKTNDMVLWQGQRLQVVEPPHAGQIVLRDPRDDSTLIQASLGEVVEAPHLLAPISRIDPGEWQLLEQKASAARKIISAASTEERHALYEQHSLKLGCSKRTLERAVRRLLSVNTVSALASERSGRREGTRLLDPRVETVVAKHLDEHWLVGNKPRLSDVIDGIQAQCRKDSVPVPCAATIRRRAASLDAYHIVSCREGSKVAKYKLKAMVGHIHAALALQQVQIDHTLADVILVSEFDRTVSIGRPWVTFAIDVATRMVVGVYVTLDSPSSISVAMCLAIALLPKESYLDALGVTGRWPCQGIMHCVHMDNGREFHGDALQRGCSELGIDIQFRPVGSPHYGGIIERLIGTMMGRCRLLPGATQSNVVERGDYDPEARAVMTLREFTAFLVNEIVNVYHLDVHRTLEIPPIAKWDELAKTSPPPRTIASGWQIADTRATFFPFEMRLIRRTGIQMWNRFYWTPELAEWVSDGTKREVLYDPADVSCVFVRGPNGELLRATCTQHDMPRLSLAELQARQREYRAIGKDPALVGQRDAGLLERLERITSAKKATKDAHRKASRAKGHQERSDAMVAKAAPASAVADDPTPLNFNLNPLGLPTHLLQDRRDG